MNLFYQIKSGWLLIAMLNCLLLSNAHAQEVELLREIAPGQQGVNIIDSRKNNNYLFFVIEGNNSNQLWRTNGCESGTIQLQDALPDIPPQNISHTLTLLDQKIWFIDSDTDGKRIISSTDGNTIQQESILPKEDSLVVISLKALTNDDLIIIGTNDQEEYLTAYHYQVGDSLARQISEVQFCDAISSNQISRITYARQTNSLLIFQLRGQSCFFMVDLEGSFFGYLPKLNNSPVWVLANNDEYLYLNTVDTNTQQSYIWRSKGDFSKANIIDSIPSTEGRYLRRRIATNKHLYYQIRNYLVSIDNFNFKDTLLEFSFLGNGSFHSTPISKYNDNIYFVSSDTMYLDTGIIIHGREPWISDGTRSGTNELTDIVPGHNSSSPKEFRFKDSLVFFLVGNKIYQYDQSNHQLELRVEVESFGVNPITNFLGSLLNKLFMTVANPSTFGNELHTTLSPFKVEDITLPEFLCASDSMLWVSYEVSGGVPPYQNNIPFPFPPQSNFQLIVEDACGSKDTTWLKLPEFVSIDIQLSSLPASQNQDDGEILATASGGTPPYIFKVVNQDSLGQLPAGTYTVVVTDSNGCSTSGEVTIDLRTGTSKRRTQVRLDVFPNPAKNNLHLQLERVDPNGEILIQISNLYGKRLYQNSSLGISIIETILVQDWTAGMYYLQVIEEGKTIERRKIILH